MSNPRASMAWVAALLAVPLACGSWWLLRDAKVAELSTAEPTASPRVAVEAPVGPAAPAVSVASIVREVPARDDNTLPDGIRIAPANSGQAHEVGMVPHPITEQHRRIFRENALIGQLNGAMDARDARGLRALTADYRDEYPEDAHVLLEAYELIAQCLEGKTVELRETAQRYYDERLDSGLRRYIRRHCLER
jgi:hypothetical protein